MGKEYTMNFIMNAQLGSQYSAAFKKAQAEVVSMQNELQGMKKTQSDISAYQKQQKALESSTEKLSNLRAQYDLLEKEIAEARDSGESTTSLEREQLRLQQQINKTADAVETHERKVSELGEALRSADINTENLTEESSRLATEYQNVKEKQQGVIDSLNAGGEKAGFFGEETVSAVEAIQGTLVAAGITRLIKEIGEAMVECGEASIEFESAITGVYKTVDGSDAQLATIKNEIKDLSTEIPATTEEIAAVAESAGQLGIATENVMAFTSVMIDLGESTNLSAEEAASSLAKFANITGTVATEYSRVGSVVVDLGNNFATTEADIVAMSTRLASSGRLAGLTEAEIMALSAAMSSVGIEAEAGGTAMTQTLSAIEKAVAQGGDALDEYARIAGMSAQEFATAWETTPIQAIQAFIAGVGRLEDQGESAVLVLEDLGLKGIRQSNMIKSLGLAAETLSSAVNVANTAWDENVALSVEAGKRYATTESQMAMLENSFSNMNVAIGDVFTPTLREVAEVGIEVTDGIAEFVEKNPELVKALAALTAGIAATSATLAGVVVVSKVVKPALVAVAGAMATSPILLMTSALVGLTTAFVALSVTAEGEAETLHEVINTHEEMAEEYADSIAAIESEASATQRLITQLDELSKKEGKTAADKAQILELCNQLNAAIPDLSLSYDSQTDSLNGLSMGLDEYIEAQAKAQVMQQKTARMIELKTAMNETEIALEQAKEQLEAYKDQYDELIDSGGTTWATASEIDTYTILVAQLTDQLAAEQAEYDELYDSVNEYTAAQEEATDSAEYSTAAISAITSEIDSLIEAYDEAYQSALASYEGQFSLWEDAGEVVETTTSDLISALESQQSYWSNYADNVDAVKERIAELSEQGYDTTALEEYVASVDTGSATAAGIFEAMADASDTNLLAIGDNYSELQTAQSEAAASTADMATGFSEKMDGMVADLEAAVQQMSKEEEAGVAGAATALAYANELQAKAGEAYNAGAYVASRAIAGLSSMKGFSVTFAGVNLTGVGYAGGTLDAPPGWAWVGENGPELMHFSGGETVLPADLSQEVATAYNTYSSVQSTVATPLAADVAEPIVASYGGGGDSGTQIQVSVAPVYQITGVTDAQGIENILGQNTEELKDFVLDVVSEAIADGERVAYK